MHNVQIYSCMSLNLWSRFSFWDKLKFRLLIELTPSSSSVATLSVSFFIEFFLQPVDSKKF